MEGDLQRRFGRNVRALRHQRGLSQERFAETIPRHPSYVGSIERGERNLSLRTIERLAEDLGVDPAHLITDDPGDGVAS